VVVRQELKDEARELCRVDLDELLEALLDARTQSADYSFSDLAENTTVFADPTVHLDNPGVITPASPVETEMLRMVDVGIALCERYRGRLDTAELSEIWFLLLDLFAKPKRVLRDRMARSADLELLPAAPAAGGGGGLGVGLEFDDELNEVRPNALHMGAPGGTLSRPLSDGGRMFHAEMERVYSRYMSYVLAHMVQVVELRVVVAKIVQDNDREHFGPFKPIIVGILDKLNFDLRTTELCQSCANDDVFKLSEDLRHTMCSAIVPKGVSCHLCGKHLSQTVQEYDTLKFFRCGHGFHEGCLEAQTECPQCALVARFGDAADVFGGAVAAQPAAGGEQRSAQPVAAAPDMFDMGRSLRRLRLMRLRLDGGRNYMDIAGQLLKPRAPAQRKEVREHASRKGLLLSPAPREPAASGEVSVGRIALRATSAADLAEHFTADEIEDIFGPDGHYVVEDAAAAGGGGDDESDEQDDFGDLDFDY
jgi:hypothetical protein